MITVLIVVGLCWFVLALLFVLALAVSAHRKPLLPGQEPNKEPVPSMPKSPVKTEQRSWWSRFLPPCHAS